MPVVNSIGACRQRRLPESRCDSRHDRGGATRRRTVISFSSRRLTRVHQVQRLASSAAVAMETALPEQVRVVTEAADRWRQRHDDAN